MERCDLQKDVQKILRKPVATVKAQKNRAVALATAPFHHHILVVNAGPNLVIYVCILSFVLEKLAHGYKLVTLAL